LFKVRKLAEERETNIAANMKQMSKEKVGNTNEYHKMEEKRGVSQS
jgi:hypothetical protein